MALPGLDLHDAVRGLIVLAGRDLAALWRQVRGAAQAERALQDILPAIIDTYGAAAATLAADWYDEARAKADVSGRFTAIPADIRDSGAQALIGWAASEATDLVAFQTLVEGGMQRRIVNFSRATVTGSSVADPKAIGWQRVGTGECGFCRMLIGRGAVYREATADFASHDHCHCSAVPAFDGEPRPVRPFTPSDRNISPADKARARAFINGEPASTKTKGVQSVKDVDASRSVAQLRETLAGLERSLAKFDSPGARARIQELRAKIAARS